jgi:RNA polymerase sporulation-specific sigma factor
MSKETAIGEGQIYQENFGLIGNVISILFTKDEIKHLGYDDLVQEGSVGLLKAIRTYDSSKSVEFSTYATICIRNEIRNYAMKNKFGGTRVGKRSQYNAIRQGNEAAEDFVRKHSVAVCGQADFPDGFSDICGRTYNPSAEEEAIVNLWIEESIKKLPSDLYKNCVREYLDVLSARETARRIGVSEASVSRAISAFREKLMESDDELFSQERNNLR